MQYRIANCRTVVGMRILHDIVVADKMAVGGYNIMLALIIVTFVLIMDN